MVSRGYKKMAQQLSKCGTRGHNARLFDFLMAERPAVEHAIQVIQEGWDTDFYNPEMVAAALLGEADSWEAEIRFEATRGKKADTVPEAVSNYRRIALRILQSSGHLKSFEIAETDVRPLTAAEQSQLSDNTKRLLKA